MTDLPDSLPLRVAGASDVALLEKCLHAERWIEEIDGGRDWFLGDWGRTGDIGLVAAAGDRPLAAAWCRRFPCGEAEMGFLDASFPVLVDIWVAPELRGRGHGTVLLTQLLDMCRTEDCRAISVATEQNNPALRLYWRLGFATIGAAGSCWLLKCNLAT